MLSIRNSGNACCAPLQLVEESDEIEGLVLAIRMWVDVSDLML